MWLRCILNELPPSTILFIYNFAYYHDIHKMFLQKHISLVIAMYKQMCKHSDTLIWLSIFLIIGFYRFFTKYC